MTDPRNAEQAVPERDYFEDTCPTCRGFGGLPAHSPDCDGSCWHCPVQERCPECNGGGIIQVPIPATEASGITKEGK